MQALGDSAPAALISPSHPHRHHPTCAMRVHSSHPCRFHPPSIMLSLVTHSAFRFSLALVFVAAFRSWTVHGTEDESFTGLTETTRAYDATTNDTVYSIPSSYNSIHPPPRRNVGSSTCNELYIQPHLYPVACRTHDPPLYGYHSHLCPFVLYPFDFPRARIHGERDVDRESSAVDRH